MTLAMNRRHHRGRIAGLFFPGLPFHFPVARPSDHRLVLPVLFANTFPKNFSGLRIESHYSRIRLTTHHYNQAAGFQDGGTPNAEKCRRYGPDRGSISLPDQFTGSEIEAHQLAIRSESITTV